MGQIGLPDGVLGGLRDGAGIRQPPVRRVQRRRLAETDASQHRMGVDVPAAQVVLRIQQCQKPVELLGRIVLPGTHGVLRVHMVRHVRSFPPGRILPDPGGLFLALGHSFLAEAGR